MKAFIPLLLHTTLALWLSKDDVSVRMWLGEDFVPHGDDSAEDSFAWADGDGELRKKEESPVKKAVHFEVASNSVKLRLDFETPVDLNKVRVHAKSQDHRPDFGYTHSGTESKLEVVYEGEDKVNVLEDYDVSFGPMDKSYEDHCHNAEGPKVCSEWMEEDQCAKNADKDSGSKCKWFKNKCIVDHFCGAVWADIEGFSNEKRISTLTITLFSASSEVTIDEVNVDGLLKTPKGKEDDSSFMHADFEKLRWVWAIFGTVMIVVVCFASVMFVKKCRRSKMDNSDGLEEHMVSSGIHYEDAYVRTVV